MYQIQLKFQGQNKKINIPKPSLPTNELHKLIAQCFNICDRIIGVTNKTGQFLQLAQFNSQLPTSTKNIFSLVTAKDLNQDNMSFASEYYKKQSKQQFYTQQQTTATLHIPNSYGSKCHGVIDDLQLFQQYVLTQNQIYIVLCYTKVKPTEIAYQHYLYANQQKNSVIIYIKQRKACQFYISDWSNQNPQIANFIKGILGQIAPQQQAIEHQFNQFKKRQKINEGQMILRENTNSDDDANVEIKDDLISKFKKLHQEGELSELQFYKLKSQVLQNPQDFLRKYQMGSQQEIRSEKSRQIQSSKQERRRSSVYRNKRYQIPIIVRKYNNVVEKISTSYPLTLEQEQSINLILQLELKGLISQKQAGQYKSLILQEDHEVFKLFNDYFEDNIDQIELTNKLRRKKGTVVVKEENRQRAEHNMRLLIKHAKQGSYQLLRKLALQQNKHVIGAFESYRSNKSVEQFINRLQKIAFYYRAKQELDQQSSS